ncbi:LysR family transcriptional regulator (plasmid) [Agrobacterium leguminum]|uniref:LysR family transcriptional regulator n=1 Tax=Agrobacterium leguminum TaxID=2792015 RepID=UPI0027295DBF|nr:LysR family transcriptional regulator [Agrobacterium leguminum]WLE00987.1 LysR family transcriptional regulator [Agrobacterium leguminum]
MENKLTTVKAIGHMDPLDFKALRIFLAVARTGSIRSAGEQMALAPSIVSRQIADIERNTGLPLFERTSRGVRLTDAGHLVLEHANRVREDSALLSEQLNRIKGLQQCTVRVSCGEGFLADLIEHGVKSFSDVYPGVRFAIQTGNTDEVVDAVANSDVDLGIAYNPTIDPRLRSLAISRQPLCFVAPPKHKLLDHGSLRLEECIGEPCAVLVRGHGVMQLLSRVASDAGLAVAPVIETPSIDVLRRFVMAGMGVTFLPRASVTTELARGAVGAVELSDSLLSSASAHLLVKSRRRLPTSVERLAGWLTDRMSAFRH